jgi:hypothetical protein
MAINVAVVNSRKEVLAALEKTLNKDYVIVFADRLFGFFVFTGGAASEPMYLTYKWTEALYSRDSWFFFSSVTLRQMLDLIKRALKSDLCDMPTV